MRLVDKFCFFVAGACFVMAVRDVLTGDWMWALVMFALAVGNWWNGERA